ncbi:MAG: glucan biosynthesis protein G [Rhizobiales bacterium]|nr:glucan biosynthesis protein G [Hyphomicrobiales bacterium]
MGPTRRALVKTVAGSLALFSLLGRNGIPPAVAESELFQPPSAFPEDFVLNLAREQAKQPYVDTKVAIPENWQSLTFDQYRDIRFDINKSVWRGAPHGFSIDLLHTGFLYSMPVDIYVVADGQQSRINYLPDLFTFGPLVPKPPSDLDLHYSGFRLRYPINGRDYFDEFAIFQGASYFRAIAKGQIYGLSARGLAIDTGQPQGEEFPFFRAFWIEEPPAAAATIRLHALLDSPSATGAFRFNITPGAITQMDVEVSIFPRRDLDHAGLAPLTSMYLFDELGRAGFDDYRPAVHDSDGLMMLTGAGEWIWRPLANPGTLQVSAFSDLNPRGFGLMQRKRRYGDFLDLESKYERRPSLWVEPFGAWGEGAIELYEIPSRMEVNDNIVAFWRPREKIAQGSEFKIAYRLNWAEGWPPQPPDNKALVRFSGGGLNAHQDRRLFVVDFAGDNLAGEVIPDVSASAGKISNIVLQPNPQAGGSRLTFEFDPEGAELVEFRCVLKRGAEQISETWLYRWTKS